jgi:trehalose synthase-fused probable maltokinase
MRINLGIRRRLAPLLDNDRRKIELMNALLFSLPGTPVLYYGDEIGMGDNIYLGDRNGVRTPMQWSADRNAGFSRANPQRCTCRSSSIRSTTTRRSTSRRRAQAVQGDGPRHTRIPPPVQPQSARAFSPLPGRDHPGDRQSVALQCFTVINYGSDFVLKLYRKLEEGVNPGQEVPEFLAEQTSFTATPRALGSLEYRRYPGNAAASTCIGTLDSFVPNATSGWIYTVDHLGLFFEHALAIPQEDTRVHDLGNPHLLAPMIEPVPQLIGELLGNYLDSIRVLARRTAELHAALSSRSDINDFAPEPFTTFYRHSIYHGMLGQWNRSFELLRSRAGGLAENAQDNIAEVLNREGEIRQRLLALRDKRMSGNRIRGHGDYHLSNVLFAGRDWVITNFEGDFNRSLSERRIKRSALRDVATMLRSFHYVSHAALFGDVPGIVPSRESHPQLERWAKAWYQWVSAIFLKQYLQTAGAAPFELVGYEAAALVLAKDGVGALVRGRAGE